MTRAMPNGSFRMVISRIATSKNRIGLLVPAVRSETRFVILRKFWSRYDLQHFRKWNFLGDDHGEGTVLNLGITKFRLVTLLTPPRAGPRDLLFNFV